MADRKIKFAIFTLLLVVAFAFWHLYAITQEQEPSRYYVGIGIQLGKNENDGTVFVSQVLKGGPADLAGLQPEDIIMEFEGMGVGKESRIWNLDYITNEIGLGSNGEPIRLKAVRLPNLVLPEMEIKRSVIDRVAWLPQNEWLTSGNSNCGNNSCRYNVLLSSKIQENANGFSYFYRVKNEGQYPVTISWIKRLGRVHLKPGESREFAFLHNSFPVLDYEHGAEFIIEDPVYGFFWRNLTNINKIEMGMVATFVPTS